MLKLVNVTPPSVEYEYWNEADNPDATSCNDVGDTADITGAAGVVGGNNIESVPDVALNIRSALTTDSVAVYVSVNTNPFTIAIPPFTIVGAGDWDGFVALYTVSVYTYPAALR